MKFIRKIIICLKYLFTKQDEYEYYNEDGELVIATGRHILDIIEDNNIKDKSLREMTVGMEQMKFRIGKILSDIVRIQMWSPEYDNCYHKNECTKFCKFKSPVEHCMYYELEKLIDKVEELI